MADLVWKAYIPKSLASSRDGSLGKPLACDFPSCDLRFNWPSELKRHKLCHLSKEQKRELGFICKGYGECDAHFTSLSNLRIHINTHLNKRFKCPIKGCNFSKVGRGAFSKHKRAGIHGPQFGYENRGVQKFGPDASNSYGPSNVATASVMPVQDTLNNRRRHSTFSSACPSPPPDSPLSGNTGLRTPSPAFTHSPVFEASISPLISLAFADRPTASDSNSISEIQDPSFHDAKVVAPRRLNNCFPYDRDNCHYMASSSESTTPQWGYSTLSKGFGVSISYVQTFPVSREAIWRLFHRSGAVYYWNGVADATEWFFGLTFCNQERVYWLLKWGRLDVGTLIMYLRFSVEENAMKYDFNLCTLDLGL